MTGRAWTACCLLGLAITSALLNLSASARSGRLATPPLYDDTGYLLDGFTRLPPGQMPSLWDVGASFVTDPAHSPLSTLTAMFGYALFGPHVWAPYFASTWIVVAFVLVSYVAARSAVGRVPALALAGATLLIPIVQFITTEFRPDLGAGVLFAIALYLWVTVDHAAAGPWRGVGLGILTTAAIVAKPSVFMVTIPILGMAAVIGVLRPYLTSRGSLAATVRGARLPLVVFGATFIPSAIVQGPAAVRYAFQAIVTDGDIWGNDRGLIDQWAFTAIGPGGGAYALSAFFYVGFALVVTDAVLSARKWRETAAGGATMYYLLLVPIYCVVSVGTIQTFYISSLFYFPFILAMVLAAARICSRAAGASARLTLIVGVTVAATALALSPVARTATRASDHGPNRDRMLESVATAISQHLAQDPACLKSKPVITALAPNPLSPETISLAVAMEHGIITQPNQGFFARTEQQAIKTGRASDFVLAPNAHGEAMSTGLPGTRFVKATREHLEADPQWTTIKVIAPDPPTLYAKKSCATRSAG